MGGQLSQGQFRELKKFPLLVSQNFLLAVLILHHLFEATLHFGAEPTVNSNRVVVELQCSCFENKIPYQLVVDLPADRIAPAKLFET